MMEQGYFRFVHLTDTHIMVGGKWKARGGNFEFDTEASLRRVVETVRTLDPAPAFAVLGGDLASPDLIDRARRLTPDEYEPSYELLAEILGGLPCPIHFLVGNHDNRVAFNRVLRRDAPTPDAPNFYSFDHYGYHFVALDSQEPGQNGGFLDAAQLIWLREDLKQHREQPTIAFVHHHPWPLGLQWIDTMTLRNGDELIASVDVGGKILAEEQMLEAGFRSATMTDTDLRSRITRIAALQGELRAIHLAAHILTRGILSETHIDRYNELRGYTASPDTHDNQKHKH